VLSGWLDFSHPGAVTIRSGKVEYGQGIWTSLTQVAAEELDVGLDRVHIAPVSTATSPDEGITSGSRSIEESGTALRQACAQARALLLADAAARLGVEPSALAVTDGEITTDAGGTGLTYWSLARPGLLDREAGDPVPVKTPARWSVAGHSAPRLDIPDKVTGRPRFLHDLVMPGLLYGRVIRPPAASRPSHCA
jgi:CO/xanthine dehydrogenase Mo-binding subunit